MLGDWATFFLALLLIPVLLLEETSGEPGVVAFATAANTFIWAIFALDYALDVRRATDRASYVRSHWFDLALIVVSPPMLVPPEAQALRVLRILRLARAFAVAGIVAERLDRPLTRRAALGIAAGLGILVLAGGALITALEPTLFPNIALGYAWTVATLVTAGHATPQPASAVGRAISSTIIVVGLGSFAALAASIATPRRS